MEKNCDATVFDLDAELFESQYDGCLYLVAAVDFRNLPYLDSDNTNGARGRNFSPDVYTTFGRSCSG